MKTSYLAQSIIAVAVVGSLASFSAYASAPYASNPYNQATVQDITPQTLISSDSSSDGPQPVDLKKIANQKAVKAANKAASKPPKQSGVYLSAGVGYGISGISAGKLANATYTANDGSKQSGSASVSKNKGFSFRAAVGYQFDPYFGIEAGWMHLPSAGYHQTFGGPNYGGKDAIGTGDTSVNSAVYDLLLKGMYPIGNTGVVLIAKGGLAYVRTNFSSSYSWSGWYKNEHPVLNSNVTNSGILPEVGGGIAYQFDPTWSLSLDYSYIFGKGKPDINFKNYIPSMQYAGLNVNYLF